MLAEEAFLRRKFGSAHKEWVAGTPKILPNVRKWKPPARSFFVGAVIRREYPTFASLVMAITVIKLFQGFGPGARFNLDPVWLIFCGTVVGVFFVIIHLIRQTAFFGPPAPATAAPASLEAKRDSRGVVQIRNIIQNAQGAELKDFRLF